MTLHHVAGFWYGITLYPFPCLVFEPYRGWSEQKMAGYLAGIGSFFAAAMSFIVGVPLYALCYFG